MCNNNTPEHTLRLCIAARINTCIDLPSCSAVAAAAHQQLHSSVALHSRANRSCAQLPISCNEPRVRSPARAIPPASGCSSGAQAFFECFWISVSSAGGDAPTSSSSFFPF
jgi:hypothetical protein